MQPISVTFDSNVWENIIDETKRVGQPVYENLHKHIIELNYVFQSQWPTNIIVNYWRFCYNYKH